MKAKMLDAKLEKDERFSGTKMVGFLTVQASKMDTALRSMRVLIENFAEKFPNQSASTEEEETSSEYSGLSPAAEEENEEKEEEDMATPGKKNPSAGKNSSPVVGTPATPVSAKLKLGKTPLPNLGASSAVTDSTPPAAPSAAAESMGKARGDFSSPAAAFKVLPHTPSSTPRNVAATPVERRA